jgi:hypothetical protein
MLRFAVTLVLLPFLTAGCSSSDTSPPTSLGPDAGFDAGAVFVADPIPEGPFLSIEVDQAQSDAPVVRVMGHKLGKVFGLACHVTFEGGAASAHDPVMQPFLGADEPGKARYLAKASATDAALGAARRGPAAGELDVPDPVLIATVPMSLSGAGQVRIGLARAQVRRADGTLTSVKLAGGTLHLGGGQ